MCIPDLITKHFAVAADETKSKNFTPQSGITGRFRKVQVRLRRRGRGGDDYREFMEF
jgi:hypothetical protein